MTYFIQRKDGLQLETVDEFETRKEAVAMQKEYALSDRLKRRSNETIAPRPRLRAQGMRRPTVDRGRERLSLVYGLDVRRE
jgi:hypothetical protein